MYQLTITFDVYDDTESKYTDSVVVKASPETIMRISEGFGTLQSAVFNVLHDARDAEAARAQKARST